MAKFLVWLLALLGPSAITRASPTSSTWPVENDGLTKAVEWDHYSFQLDGERIFLFGGEFHYWRLPVPEMWIDIFQKIKAAGFTAMTFYVNWGYHAANNSTLDFSTGAHDFTPFFEMAHELGLYVFLRPGPYINAETNAGGFPLWLTTGDYGELRNNDTRYTEAWKPFMSKVAEITGPYQFTRQQNVITYQIENEYGEQWIGSATDKVPNEIAIDYMELLESNARESGVDIPLTANEPNMYSISWDKDWTTDGGNVDITGLDSYPSCWTCDLSQCTGTNGVYIPYEVVDYYDYFQNTQPDMPSFMPEFQGGSFNPWGGPEGGCPQNTGPNFANLFYRWNIGQRVTAMSLYMLYGGTNWGACAAPVTATSYDYSAPISEDRSIGDKYYETKLLALFTRVAKDLTVTDLIGDGTQYTTNSAIRAFELRNPETNAGFYMTIHTNSSHGTNEAFQLHVNTSEGALTIPQHGNSIRLNGHQSKIIPTDFTFGRETLLYSTAEVLTYVIQDHSPTLVLWVPTGESGEFAIKGAREGCIKRCQGCSGVDFYTQDFGLVVTFTQAQGMSVLELDTGTRVVLLDRTSAYLFWAPTLSNDVFSPEFDSVLVQGPYLVRSAERRGSELVLTGDTTNDTTIEVFSPRDIRVISWNGANLQTSRTEYGTLTASLETPSTVTLPSLSSWKWNDSLPERFVDYDDSGPAWVAADHMTTLNPTTPGSLPVLYADEYGFHNGVRLWRGYFSGNATEIYLNVQGGYAFGWSAWVNGQLLGSYLGDAEIETAHLTLPLTNITLNDSEPNVLLVVHDDTGHDETSGALNPRGILQASLYSTDNKTQFSHWRVAGTAGGESNIDPVRGPYNEDGLYAERVGWHLPGFNDNEWNGVQSLSFEGAGVRFYRTVVPLDIPEGLDVSISFILSAPSSVPSFRAQLFVNGYQYGRFYPYVGNQVAFPVPPGILDYSGDNTIGLAVWAQTEEGANVEVSWQVNYVASSSLDVRFDGSELRPAWTSERLQYA